MKRAIWWAIIALVMCVATNAGITAALVITVIGAVIGAVN